VLEACRDEIDYVRIHAVAAARLLPRDRAAVVLWEGLGDRSWWVRRSAADAMAELGPPGLGELGRAAVEHPDRYARDIAAQTLRDRVPDVVQAVAG
jgi:HEAT repeat protein